jgi:hypothetical protein
MKNLQVRLPDDVYEIISDSANARGASIAEWIRGAIERHVIELAYAEEGKRLYWYDDETNERVEVVIPGLTVQRLRRLKQSADAATKAALAK